MIYPSNPKSFYYYIIDGDGVIDFLMPSVQNPFKNNVMTAIPWEDFNAIAFAKPAPNPVAELSRSLPAMDVLVELPCSCEVFLHSAKPDSRSLRSAIIHLNDEEPDWDRNRIADWVQKLHDEGTINADFQPWEEDVVPDTTELLENNSKENYND